MSYLIDSDWLIDAVAGNRRALATIAELTANTPSISTISSAEVCDGAYGTPDPIQALIKIRDFLGSFAVLPVTIPVADRFAVERAMLRRQGLLIPDMEFLIAATTLEHDLALVHRNHRHVARIPGLRLE